ncbi:LysR family transcriptional regulator [Piscinibacter terrae]|uniref:LysR family transcriptional regulator n=1 Tax=Piscinibacter terrae TaxID=2496871 RepID=A0A3N7HNV7_9BURK|nr:LysR family transcriptional regulator [Albitalea terrae]RQP23867.1 LysR family transcriptional regulator [Albitalea terrae]
MAIREVDFRKIDLNLLVVFHALMREQSVARAAERLFLGASAVSMSLRRLRELFDDTLFVRSGQRMVPTGRAEELAAPIENLLIAAHKLVYERSTFRPADLDRVFRIGANESCEVGLVAQLLAELRQQAPSARLVVRTTSSANAATLIDAGDIELALGYFKDVPSHHDRETACHHQFECLFDARTAKNPLSLEDYLQADHVLMSTAGDLEGVVDLRLRELGLKRKVVASTARFSALPSWLQRSPLIATVPAHVGAELARASGLVTCAVPFDLPGYDVQMSWHKRLADDAAATWLRQLVRRVSTEMFGERDTMTETSIP